MRAIQAVGRGGYEALHAVNIPQPHRQAGHALVRVTSARVTPLDRTVTRAERGYASLAEDPGCSVEQNRGRRVIEGRNPEAGGHRLAGVQHSDATATTPLVAPLAAAMPVAMHRSGGPRPFGVHDPA